MTSQLPDYAAATAALQTLSALGNAAETHGLLCALLSGNAALRQDAWLDSMLTKHLEAGDLNLAKAQKILGQLYDSTKAMFASENFALQLLLPGDEAPFEQRLEALVHWCQGFLSGINRVGLNVKAMSPEVADAMKDLHKIACLNYSDEVGDEASETAYTELSEYVRVASMLLYGELQARLTANSAKLSSLH